jgi:hypothetical protein
MLASQDEWWIAPTVLDTPIPPKAHMIITGELWRGAMVPVVLTVTRPTWCLFHLWRNAFYPSGATIGSKTFYYPGEFYVWWLGPGEAWHSWPLAMPSKRDTPQGPPLGWPPPIITTEEYTYTLDA